MAAQPSALNAPFEYIFPSIRGIQAKRIFSNEEALAPELWAPRLPNKGCAPETARYIVFFLDVGLERCQQMCADLNRHVVPPSTSISVLYDHRDDGARLTKLALPKLPQRSKKIALSDWTRGNAKLWEGRALVGGKVSEATTNVVLPSNALKERLGLGLTPEEQRAEDTFRRGHPGTN